MDEDSRPWVDSGTTGAAVPREARGRQRSWAVRLGCSYTAVPAAVPLREQGRGQEAAVQASENELIWQF